MPGDLLTPEQHMRLVQTLIYHQRKDAESCICGWSVLGASHAEHVVEMFEAANQLAERVVCMPEQGDNEAVESVGEFLSRLVKETEFEEVPPMCAVTHFEVAKSALFAAVTHAPPGARTEQVHRVADKHMKWLLDNMRLEAEALEPEPQDDA